MSATPGLTAELRKEVLALEDDLRSRVAALPEVSAQWRGEYDAARSAERTAASWEEWRDERVTLAAVSWVLTTVFVRFCEDNGLVKQVWITHAGGRGREATDAQAHFLRETARTNPDVTDREWLLEAVQYLKGLPATAGLVDETSPMWLVSPSGDAATRILNFWRARNDDGRHVRDLPDADLDTRFLGDLYQDISEAARKRYALLQTPVFVEEFILDRTLEPALVERPLEGFKAIDPTCGSGHFLLGIFARLLDRWHSHAPAMDERERVQAALDAVHGVDLNPFAVAIARFRLTVAAVQACGISSLEEAPAFRYHLAAGDSLLHGLDQEEFDFGAGLSTDRVAANFAYATENLSELKRILRRGQYDCVVGNPPYITVKDGALNKLYRSRYSTCHRKYALTAPFAERIFDLAKTGPTAGWTGQITSNSFMTREFGVPLIEKFLPQIDVLEVIDTSGVPVPGHGTSTAILIGKNRAPGARTVRVVLGIKGDPENSSWGAQGAVWSSIVSHIDEPGFEDQWISVKDLPREDLATHPWSLSGGGVLELLQLQESSAQKLESLVLRVGFFGVPGSDEVMTFGADLVRRKQLNEKWTRHLVVGDDLRDYGLRSSRLVWFPYQGNNLAREAVQGEFGHYLWPYRTVLGNRATFSRETYFAAGRPWFEWHQLPADEAAELGAIAYAEVTSHNHVFIESGDRALTQTAPIIKFARGTKRESWIPLLAILGSSAACFWLKQRCHNKGSSLDSKGARQTAAPWEDIYQFNSTRLLSFPLPPKMDLSRASRLVELSERLVGQTPAALMGDEAHGPGELDQAKSRYQRTRGELVALQEELDWEVYGLYGFVDEDLSYSVGSTDNDERLPSLALGERAFEIVLARKAMAGEEDLAWFERHGSTPITEIPAHWPAGYQRLVERRIELIESQPYVRLLEKPEHKRRWALESWEKQEERALRGWLLDRLEGKRFWVDAHGRPTPKSVATLADEVARETEMVDVLVRWEGRPDVPVVESLTKVLAKEGVPFLAAYRYKEPGLRKRAAWERTWNLQRREDVGTYDSSRKGITGEGPIPVPPEYKQGDFARTEYWSHRGRLDVPKERFILYPDAGRETDPTLVLGWAGWDHAQQALALAMLIQDRQDLDGWSDEQLVPLVAGLAEVLPWVEQWHAEPSELYGGVSPAEFFGQQLDERMAQVSATRDTLREWRPAPPARGRKRKA